MPQLFVVLCKIIYNTTYEDEDKENNKRKQTKAQDKGSGLSDSTVAIFKT